MLLVFLACAPKVHAQETEEDEDVTLAPYFYIEGADPAVDYLPLKGTEVETNISGTMAETYVTQIYANEGEHPINARYVFPASTQVCIHGMTMQIGDQLITAQIREKQEAKKEFEEAKSEGKSASLLEEQRANVFTMDVANIMPGDEVRIELHYTEMISPAEGIYEFVFPTVVGPRYAGAESETEEDDDWVASPYLGEGSTPQGSYDITVNLSAGVPITELKSSSHEIDVEWENDTEAKVTLSKQDSEEFAGNRDFILDYKLTGEKLETGLLLYEGEDENFFQLTVQPPERYQTADVVPREYIFLLDVSGSMEGYPLDTAKALIQDLVSNLRKTDRFNVVIFSDVASQLALESLPATKVNMDCAMKLIDRQTGGGGTELLQAMECAADMPMKEGVSRSVVIITDGYISNESDIFEHINKNMADSSFFAFGIGSSVNRSLIEGIAKTGMGESFIVTEETEAEETAERFRTYIEAPLLTDIQIGYKGFDVYDVTPENIPTLFAQKPIVIFGKWKGEPSGSIYLTGKAGNKDYKQKVEVSEAASSDKNEVLRYLWARKRVETLTDYGFGSDDKTVKAEVTKIGLQYSMMTPYTSFVAVLDTVRNPDGTSKDVDQPSPLPKGVSELALGGYMLGSEPGDLLLILALIFAAGMGYFENRRKKEKRSL